MILNEFIKTYGLGCGNDLISIEGYCEEYCQDDVISATWYDKIKYKVVKRWQTIGGGMYPIEICIELDEKQVFTPTVEEITRILPPGSDVIIYDMDYEDEYGDPQVLTKGNIVTILQLKSEYRNKRVLEIKTASEIVDADYEIYVFDEKEDYYE